MTGVSEQYTDVRKWSIQSGEFFTDVDVRTAARVIVIAFPARIQSARRCA